MRIIPCPIDGFDEDLGDGSPRYYVGLPDVWLGKHEARKTAAINGLISKGISIDTFLKFAGSMAVLEDWSLPGIPKNPEDWNFDDLDLRIMAWVNNAAWDDLKQCFVVKKKPSK